MQEKDFKKAFSESLNNRGINVSKLAELSGVPERYVEALHSGNFERLPAAPYVRGYISKIAAALGLNAEELWSAYSSEYILAASGPQDRLPENRFSLKKVGKEKVWGMAAILAVLIGLGLWRFNDIIGMPYIEINNPLTATAIVNTDHIMVDGFIKSGDKLTINGEAVQPREDGRFAKEIRLDPGINTIEFNVKRFLGRETDIVKKVIYQPQGE